MAMDKTLKSSTSRKDEGMGNWSDPTAVVVVISSLNQSFKTALTSRSDGHQSNQTNETHLNASDDRICLFSLDRIFSVTKGALANGSQHSVRFDDGIIHFL
jgi:hypothetical protein